MTKSVLTLEAFDDNSSNSFRAIIKTKHGRVLFISLKTNASECIITNCFYIDRCLNKKGADRYSSKPQKLHTFCFELSKLLLVIETELDKKFYDMEFVKNNTFNMSIDEYITEKTNDVFKKYSFLIMVGNGNVYNGLPIKLHTRLKNRFHRSVFINLEYYKDGKGVVKECYYYDRKYIRRNVKITPPGLVSCFFPYNKQGILDLINYEICCNFTHIIITDEQELLSGTMPICGFI